MKRNFITAIALTILVSILFVGCAPKTKQAVAAVKPVPPTTQVNTTIDSGEEDRDKIPNKKPINIPVEKTPVKETILTPTILPSISGLSTQRIGWSWAYSPKSSAPLLSKYHGYAFGDTSEKVIYLTFDEGYEYGYTASILDTLKSNNVKASFFVTEPYVTGTFKGTRDADLVKRMADEGHVIGNHSVHHKSMPTITDEAAFDAELTGVESAVAKIPGAKLSKNFRPPMGDFSELSLYYTQKLGYKTIFFAFAYNDYDVNNQPDPVKAKSFILNNTKQGMICLLHAESKTNAEILDSLLKAWKSEGYSFKTLEELP